MKLKKYLLTQSFTLERLEMERVLPQLKIVVKSDNRDWRTHFDQIKSLRNNIEQVRKGLTDEPSVLVKIQFPGLRRCSSSAEENAKRHNFRNGKN